LKFLQFHPPTLGTHTSPSSHNSSGDVDLFSPGEKHWHGAAATTAMTHITLQERPGA